MKTYKIAAPMTPASIHGRQPVGYVARGAGITQNATGTGLAPI